MKLFLRNHPLAFVLLVALALRIPAVICSKGFMASDDHYETVHVAYKWLQSGLSDAAGHLSWDGRPGAQTARFPLYNLFLYGIMRTYKSIGITSLDTIMYGVRAIHALLSLLSVWCAFRLVEIATKSKKYALIAGLAAAAHFALPYLGVRNLIEMVSGHFWLLSLTCLYAYQYGQKKTGYLFLAGLLTGLAWMIRFEIATAAVIVPFVIWYLEKNIRPAIWYSFGVALMLILSGVMDWALLGQFGASTINHIAQINYESAIYETTPFIYILLLLGLLVPPFSILGIYLSFRNSVWRKHLLLIATITSFVIIHTIQESRQERYIIPMLVPAILLTIFAVIQDYECGGMTRRKPNLLRWSVVPAIVINFVLLPILTLNYSKKGDVEPVVQIEKDGGTGAVLFFSPEIARFFPLAYLGYEARAHEVVQSWEEFRNLRRSDSLRRRFTYVAMYPRDSVELTQCVDSVETVTGPLRQWKQVTPSPIDWLVHKLNPTHNLSNGAWVYKVVK